MLSLNQKPNNNLPTLLMAVATFLIWAFVIFLASSIIGCSPSKKMDKAYVRVSTDPAPATEQHKAQLANWVAGNFPIRELTTEKVVTKVIIDTSKYKFFREYIVSLNNQLSIKNCPELNVDSIFKIAAESITPNTIFETRYKETKVRDTVGNWVVEKKMAELMAINASKDAQIAYISQKLVDSSIDLTEAKQAKHKLIWWLVIVSIFFFVSHYLRSKIKFPFL